ncbi:hypothetical protein ES703_57044 [subsurface metagenome]
MIEVIFLSGMAVVWITFAVIQDLKKREVANWLNFSLIIFALGFRFFYCLFSQDAQGFSFFYQGLIGLGIFFVIGNLLYYGRMFAGGDAKLMIALGAILPFSENFLVNTKIFVLFFFIFLFVGAFYSLTISIILSLKNLKAFKKEFYKQLSKKRKIIYPVMFLGLILMAFGFIESLLFGLGILIFILPYFYVYAKAVDEVCMVKKVKTSQLVEGDWLYKDLKVRKKLIKVNWGGLSKEEIREIKNKYKEIKIKQGIPFTPVFLFSFLILILLYFLKIELWNILW